jgi:hypothetical protein
MKKLIELIANYRTILRYGFTRFDDDRFEKSCLKTYGTKQLPTVDLLSLNPPQELKISPYSFLDGTSLVSDLYLLKLLASKYAECNYLEIGSWRGESLANVADVAKKCVSVTLSQEEMVQLNFGKKFASAHGIFSKDLSNVTTHYANSRTFNFESLGQRFDLIFVDGDHSYAGVLNDTKKVFDLRKDSSSIIVWHDYGYSPETVRFSTLKGILDGIPKEKHKYLYHISNTLCAVYIENEKFNTYITQFPSEVNKYFELDVRIHRK